MPRPSLTDEQRKEIRRSIRKAASDLYAEGGIQGISARTVAEKAGVSVGTIYAHFENLSGLMQSLWRGPVVTLLGDLEVALAAETEPQAKLRVLLATYAEFSRTHASVYRGAFLFVRPESVAPPPQAKLKEDRFFRLFSDTIAEAQSAGCVRSGNPEQLAQIVWGAVHGAIALPTNMHRLELQPAEQAVDQMIEVMLEWLCTQAPSADHQAK